jgi:L-amino acid N-acyltransferase YncA
VSDLIIRTATLADAAALSEIYAPMVLADVSTFESEPPTPEQIASRMSGGFPWLVAACEGVVVGYSYASAFRERAAYRWTVETSVRIAPDAQGRGVGRTLYAALLAELTSAGYVNAVALISLPNPASVALHSVLGFTRVGVLRRVGYKFEQWIDVEIWERELAGIDRKPVAPTRWSPS